MLVVAGVKNTVVALSGREDFMRRSSKLSALSSQENPGERVVRRWVKFNSWVGLGLEYSWLRC